MIKQGRAGMLVAFVLGLAVATAGTATAAKLITGKQIKNGSIARKDLSTGRPGGAVGVREAGPAGHPGAAGHPPAPGREGRPGRPGVVPAPQAPIVVTSFRTAGKGSAGDQYTVSYWKDASGVVHLTGGLTGGTVSTGIASVEALNLPAGYRPSQVQYFPVVSTGGAPGYTPVGGAYVEICSSSAFCAGEFAGDVSVFGADNYYVSLDGITFRAG